MGTRSGQLTAGGGGAGVRSGGVAGGSTVVFSPKNSYIDRPGGRRVPLELQGNIYTLKLWVPRNQDGPFQGQA